MYNIALQPHVIGKKIFDIILWGAHLYKVAHDFLLIGYITYF